MNHWTVAIAFEAEDKADADRLLQRMLEPVNEENRLLLPGTPWETDMFFLDPSPQPEPVGPDEWLAAQ